MDAKSSSYLPWPWFAGLSLFFVLSLGWLGYGNLRAGSEPWQIAASTLLLAVPVGLMCAGIGLLAAGWRCRKQCGQLTGRLKTWLYRAPRGAAILVILFVTLFSLDVFGMEGDLWTRLGAFVMHSLPSIGMAVLLVLAWRWEWVGFAAFMLAALFFLRSMLFDPLQGVGLFLIFSGPMAVIALLFGANWLWRKELRPII